MKDHPVPTTWNFRFRSPSWLWPVSLEEDKLPSFGFRDFEGQLKIPDHVHKHIDFKFMADWFDRISRYAEFEFEKLLDEKSRKQKK